MIEPVGDLRPVVDPTAYVHPSAVVVGDVVVGARASIWPNAVLRGDQGRVEVGEETNIQDGVVCHSTHGLSTTRIGPRVVVGHRAILHGCEIVGDALVGMGAILLDNCVIEPFCLVGAGALVPAGRRIPARSLVLGSPARVVRELTDEEIDRLVRHGVAEYLALRELYLSAGSR